MMNQSSFARVVNPKAAAPGRAQHSTGLRRRCATLVVAASVSALSLACQQNSRSEVEVGEQRANEANRHMDPNAATPQGAPTNEVAPASAAATAHAPYVGNLGRNFQGEIVAEVKWPGQQTPATIRYASHSDKARIQLQGAPKNFDVLADGKALYHLDHASKSYRKFDLDDMKKDHGDHTKVESEKSGERSAQQGVECELRTMKAEDYRIETCVGGVHGEFEVGVIERVAGVRLPDWAATLIEDTYLPLRAKGFKGDKPWFEMEVTRYSPDPVPAAVLELPMGYKEQS